MRYYVKVVCDGVIDRGIHIFGTLTEAKLFKRFSENRWGNKATIYKIELVPVEGEE